LDIDSPPEKNLIIKEGTIESDTGYFSQGNIINFGGIIRNMAYSVSNGVYINYGDIHGDMSSNALGGVHVNFSELGNNKFYGRYADGISNGIAINFGLKTRMANDAGDGVQINLGRVINDMAFQAHGGCQFNFGQIGSFARLVRGGYQLNMGIIDEDHPNSSNKFQRTQTIPKQVSELEEKVREIEYMRDLKVDDAIDVILSYDWKTFEHEIFELAERIKEKLE